MSYSSQLLDQKPAVSLGEFLSDYNELFPIDIERAEQVILDTTRYYKSKGKYDAPYIFPKAAEARWYGALDRGEIDYSFYNDDDYFTDIWVCWILYSRRYLIQMINDHSSGDKTTSIASVMEPVRRVFDLGCGIAYSTAALTEIFPHAQVYGTNLPGPQFDFGEKMAERYGFTMLSEIPQWPIDPVDLVLAFEYFEHIEAPLHHLQEIIDRWTPRMFYLANSFNTVSAGHFRTYRPMRTDTNALWSQGSISRVFNRLLVHNGYEKVKTTNWNNKPSLWRRRK